MTTQPVRHDYDFRLFAPFLIHCILFQVVTGLTRVTASYRAIELDVSYVWYGAINSGYALLPIFFAIALGRYIDRGHDAQAVWTGALFQLAANLGFFFWPANPLALTAYSVIGGVGHLFIMAGHQALTLRCSGPASREGVFGWYMVVLSVGQMIAPAIIGWLGGSARVPPVTTLFAVALAFSLGTAALAFVLRPDPGAADAGKNKTPAPLSDLLRTRGLVAVILASVVTVASMDLVVIYLPLLGVERHIEAGHIGSILVVRAAASMASRILYGPLLRLLGRASLTFWSMAVATVGYVLIGLPLSLPYLYGAAVLIGFGLGVAVTVCLSNLVDLAPPQARGTAMTMRLTGNRLGQFAIPFAGSVIAAAAGVGGVFIIIAGCLLATGAAVRMILRRK